MNYLSTIRRIIALLTPSERKRGLSLFALMVVGMLLETLGIGLVIPAVAVLVDSDLARTYPALGAALDWLGNPTDAQLITVGMAVLVGVYVVKALFLSFLGWYQNRFAFGVQEHASLKLFAVYLHQPYTFHLQRNSAQLIRNVVNEVNKLWFLVLNPALVVLSEGLVLVGVTCLLFVFEPVGALILVLVLAVGAGAFHFKTRAQLLQLGHARQDHDGLRIQQLQEGLGGVKEVKILGREDSLLAKYGRHNAESARVERLQATLQLMPRLWIEVFAVAGLAALVLTMLAQGNTAAAIVPTLGLFAAAAFRLMPSAYRVIGAVQNFPYALPIITTIHEELKLAPMRPPQVDVPVRRIEAVTCDIRLVNVDYTYPDATVPALTGVNISIRQGESVGFVGPSGAGKSTLVDVVLGLLTPTTGRVLVDGRDIQEDLSGWQQHLGYVAQAVYLSDDTLRHNVAFGLFPHQIDEAAVQRAIAAAQLGEFVASLPAGLDTLVGERGVRLSGGQRQRIGIARALYRQPPVLVLDEATSALDRQTEEGVVRSVAALEGKTVLIVSHRLSTVERCSRLFRLENGRVVDEGVPADLERASIAL